MARYNYFNIGDHFSEFHRKFDGLAGVDLDLLRFVRSARNRWLCLRPRLIKDKLTRLPQLPKKNCKSCKVPSYLVFYTPGLLTMKLQNLEYQINTKSISNKTDGAERVFIRLTAVFYPGQTQRRLYTN